MDKQKAIEHFGRGIELKKAGDLDLALTEFRKAVIEDPSHLNSQYEIGLLCKTKASYDPYFLKHAYEAFRIVSKADLYNQNAHDNYIMIGQKLGKLDDLLLEYENLQKNNPTNELIARCKKNIVTISMALIPEKVNVSGSGVPPALRKVVMFISIGAIVCGLGIAIAVPALAKSGKIKLDAEAIRGAIKVGLGIGAGGVVGLIISSKLK